MATNLTPPLFEQPPTRAKRLCGICKSSGHDRRNCARRVPTLVRAADEIADDNQFGVNARVLPPAVPQPTQRLPPRMSLEECIYLLFDLEMIGGSKTDDDITEIAATIIGPDSVLIEDGTFQAMVKLMLKPKKQVTIFMRNLFLGLHHWLHHCGSRIFQFPRINVHAIKTTTNTNISKVLFVAHKGQGFDIPFLLHR